METWVERVNFRASIVHDQIVAARLIQDQTGADLSGNIARHMEILDRLYAEEYPSAKLRDTSDFVLRAEGPGTDHDAPSVTSFNWMTDHVRVQLRKLTEAVLPMTVSDARSAARKVVWSFTGYAPGSIMLGYALRVPDSMPGFEGSTRDIYLALSESVQSIASVPQFVDDAGINAGISEVFGDPALRDSALVAAFNLSPTNQSGIHTIEIAARNGDSGHLSGRERMILKNAVDRPEMRTKRLGTFIGSLRAADLDKRRAVLRDVSGTDSAIRCILDERLDATSIRNCFGNRVLVSGEYETDREGRPRLMHVHTLLPVEPQPPLI